MRRHDLDRLRTAGVLLVVVYHAFYLFNACGVFGAVGTFAQVQPQDALLPFVYPWFMVMLYAVAGMASRYALTRRTPGAFAADRTRRLLLPSTLGLFVFHWITGWFYGAIGGGFGDVPGPVRYVIYALSGTGPLWFAQLLWVYSMAFALIAKLDRGDRLYALCGRCPVWALPLLALPLWGAAQIGNVPLLTTYRIGVYGMAYFLGAFFLTQEGVASALSRGCGRILAVSLVLGCVYIVQNFGKDYTDYALLRTLLTNIYAWLMTLALLGCFHRWANKQTRLSAYLHRAGFGIYALHYLPMLVTAWLLYAKVHLTPVLIYPLCIAAGLFGSLALWEVLRRIPVLRLLVLGIKER